MTRRPYPSFAASRRRLAAALAFALALAPGARAQHGAAPDSASAPSGGHIHAAPPVAPSKNFLGDAARRELGRLVIQDFQGRMKPLDTLSREMLRKIAKHERHEGWEPLDLYLSWAAQSRYWFEQPVIAVRNPELKDKLGVAPSVKAVSAASLVDARGQYALTDEVEKALRTPDAERSKYQRQLLSFDERVHLFFMSLRQTTLRIYPVPADPNHSWLGIEDVLERSEGQVREDYIAANNHLLAGLRDGDQGAILQAAREHAELQRRHGAEVLIGGLPLAAELMLNRANPFPRLIAPYLLGFALLVAAYIVTLARRRGARLPYRHPLYLIGLLLFWAAVAGHLIAFILRWIASGRAPLSNGYESLLWISLMVAVAGLLFELRYRRGLVAGLAALLTAVVLGVSMFSTFDPAIGPLVPVLASYWLNIHVTVITASYGFLGLSALIAMAILVMHLFKGAGREVLRDAVAELHRLHWSVMVAGLGLLSIGTLLGGVWANESWGRYWGWDSKETWSLVTILIYALVSHFRFVPSLSGPWPMAAASFMALCSVVMTYFGVNYFLAGLHSYAAGDAARVPPWVYVALLLMLALLLASGWRDRRASWGATGAPRAAGDGKPEPTLAGGRS